jgi:hypothetical protein
MDILHEDAHALLRETLFIAAKYVSKKRCRKHWKQIPFSVSGEKL